MPAKWQFRDFRPGDRARNSQVEKFFRSDVVEDHATAVIREGIQNSLDAALADESGFRSVNVQISFGQVPAKDIQGFIPGLFAHLESVREKLPDVPAEGEPVSYLTFEDFNTTGLRGDPEQWEPQEGDRNAFFNFFRGEGVSSKSEQQRGRHGVGKMVFTVASRARSVFGLTATDDSTPLLMGTSTLVQHRCEGQSFHPDGWFGASKQVNDANLVIPVRDPAFISRFSETFGLDRESLPGLSIVVPWLDPSISPDASALAVVRGFFWPVMQARLFVEIRRSPLERQLISNDSLATVIHDLGERFPDAIGEVRANVTLAAWAQLQAGASISTASVPPGNAQEWNTSLLPADVIVELRETLTRGNPVALRLPINIRKKKAKQPACSEFCLYIISDPNCREGCIQFIREGLLVSGVRARRCPGYRALVIIEDGPLATFLGDAENPSHTEWQKENVRDKYSFHDSCLRYVIQSVPNILKTLHDDQPTADPTLLLDLFSLPGKDDTWPPAKLPGKKSRDGGKDLPKPPPPPPPPPPRYSLNKQGDGFVIRRGNPAAVRPLSIALQIAYGVRRGNPFKKYDKADFDLTSRSIKVALQNCAILQCEANELHVEVLSDDFEIGVAGFDTNRDLHVNIRLDTEDREAANVPQA